MPWVSTCKYGLHLYLAPVNTDTSKKNPDLSLWEDMENTKDQKTQQKG